MLAADTGTGDIIDGGVEAYAHLALDHGAVDSPGLSPGDKVGDFEIMAELGRGGMGIVYAARDGTLGRIAALKLLPARTTIDSVASDRLIAEAQAASALDHPNVATIYQVGETEDGRRFIAMARYEGETLRTRLSRGPVKPRSAYEIARQVASALAAAHAAGLVHRDVKPENIFITNQGLVKLLDFGIATLAGSPRDGPTTRGTVLYMSPEHARRRPADARSDVWSLGIVLYEMLVGRTPFIGQTAEEVLGRIADSAPVPLPPEIRGLPSVATTPLVRALDKNPEKRYTDASGLAADLEKATQQWSRARFIKVSVGVAAAAMILFTLFAQSTSDIADDAARPELAVMPVAGDSSNSETTALASALSDEIAARLIGLGRVRLVRPADSSATRPGLHFLRVVISPRGSSAMVAVSLIDASSGRTEWRENRSFDRSGLRELGRDVVIGVLDVLGEPVTDRERGMIGSSFPSSAEAYAEFLRANRFLAIRTPPALESAVVHYRRASQLDTTFAAAYARQSYAYSVLLDWGWKPTRALSGDPVVEGLALAETATRLDSTSAEAWLAHAYMLLHQDPKRYTGVAEAFQYAIALDPYNAEAFHQYGQALTGLGRYAEAMAAYRRTIDLEPDRAMTFVPMAAIAKRQGRLDESLRFLDNAIKAAPKVPYALATRSMLRSELGMIPQALEDAELGLSLDSVYPIPPLTALARATWLAGDTVKARKQLNDAFRAIANQSAPTYTEAYWVATAAVVMGETQRAVRLVRDTKPRGPWLWFLFEAPEFNSFRKIPEVAAILAEADPRRPPR
jgi:serine/threonine protein kinase